ncbi:MAG TPA: VWA domain-containing protein [Terracidiphilus sp.]|jgi:VWFA-related protein
MSRHQGNDQLGGILGCTFHRVCAIALLAATAGVVLAQQPAASSPANPETQGPGVSQTVDEVTLELAVQDKKHKKVLDLKPEDLEITDNDVPVKLGTFQLVQGNSQSDQLVTMVFDHFEGAGAKTAQNVAAKILKMLPSNAFSFALFDFGNRLQLLQSFTNDRSAMVQAIVTATANRVTRLSSTDTMAINIAQDQADGDRERAAKLAEKNLVAIIRTGADSQGGHVDAKLRAQSQTLFTALKDTHKVMQDQHTRLSLAGLLAIVRSQQKINERKSIIYFTSGFQTDTGGKEMIKTISGAAARAGVTFYTVDMDAMDVGTRHQIENAMLNGGAPFNPAPQPVPGSGGIQMTNPAQQQQGGAFNSNPLGTSADFMMRTDDRNPFSSTKSPLADLARDTGGVYVDAQEGVKRQLDQMRESMTTYYRATYKPPIEEYDGSFRTIVAKPKRAGLNIKTKSGYFALAPGAEAGIRPFEVPLLKIFDQSNLPHDVKFHAAVLQFGELPDGNSSTVAIDVPISALQVNKDTHTNLFTAHVSIVAEIRDKSGTVVEHFGENIAKRGALESLDTDKAVSILLQRHFLAIPGEYMLDAAVYDEIGLKYGAARIVFQIPPVQVTPSLSPIVLVQHADSINDDNEDPLEPMRYEKSRITPNLAGVVPAGAKNVSLFFILHPDPKSKAPVTLEVEAARNGHPGRRTPLPLKLNNDGEAVPYLASFKGASLAPGSYEVKAMLTQDGKTAIEQAAFTVQGNGGMPDSPNAEGHGGGAADLASASEVNDSYSGGPLAITSETNAIQPPTSEEIGSLIADTRTHAVGYTESLPNFMCIEVTNRSVDTNGTGNWKHRDTIAELLRYRDKTESHTMLEINGQASSVDRDALLKQKGSTLSGGELGGVLKAVFSPSAKADFTWKETDSLGSGSVQVFDYRVEKSNSMFSVVGSNDQQLIVGFHGQVYIDSATHSVRRISLQADDLPKDFPTRATVMGVDYDYVVINDHDYLMPISAEVRVRQSHRQAVLNTIEFRDYRKYGSQMKILNYKQVENQKQ